MIGDDGRGPVAESVDAGAVQCSLSWFKSRPGLQASPLRGFGWRSQPSGAKVARRSLKGEDGLSLDQCPKSRLMVALKPFRGCEIWSKDHPRARGNPAPWLEGRAARAPFFCARFPIVEA